MKTYLTRCTLVLALVITTMGMNACPGNGGMGSVGVMTAEESQLGQSALAAINAHRASKGLAALTWYDAGAQVAYEHCVAMQMGGFFSHVDPSTGTDPATRALNAGITHDPSGSIDPTSGNPFVGENIFTETNTNPTGQDVVDAWVGSSGHHAQIDAPLLVIGESQAMPAWTHCGIGVFKSGNESWWTAVFFRNPS